MKRRPDWFKITTWTLAVLLGVAAWLLVILAFKAFTMPAVAHATESPHVRADLEVAQRFWKTDVCRGQWQVQADPTLIPRGRWGEATGLGFIHNPEGGVWTDDNGVRWDWYIKECVFTIDPTLHGGRRRCTVGHEMGHFVYGPGHEGFMSQDAWHFCVRIADAMEAAIHQAAILEEEAKRNERNSNVQSADVRRNRVVRLGGRRARHTQASSTTRHKRPAYHQRWGTGRGYYGSRSRPRSQRPRG